MFPPVLYMGIGVLALGATMARLIYKADEMDRMRRRQGESDATQGVFRCFVLADWQTAIRQRLLEEGERRTWQPVPGIDVL
jgi:hypothetical protein